MTGVWKIPFKQGIKKNRPVVSTGTNGSRNRFGMKTGFFEGRMGSFEDEQGHRSWLEGVFAFTFIDDIYMLMKVPKVHSKNNILNL